MSRVESGFENSGKDYLPVLTEGENGCIRWQWQDVEDFLDIQLRMLKEIAAGSGEPPGSAQ